MKRRMRMTSPISRTLTTRTCKRKIRYSSPCRRPYGDDVCQAALGAEDDNVLKTRTYDIYITYDQFHQTPKVYLQGYGEVQYRICSYWMAKLLPQWPACDARHATVPLCLTSLLGVVSHSLFSNYRMGKYSARNRHSKTLRAIM